MLKRVTSVATKNLLRNNAGVFSANPSITTLRDYSTKRKNFAMLTTGIGFLDGTDITEATSLSIHLGEVGFSPVFFAPEGRSEETYDHATRVADKNEIRDIHAEVSRLSRSKVLPMKGCKPKAGDFLVIPGGGGLAMLLPGFKESTENFEIATELEAAIKEFHKEGKPIIATSNGVIAVARVLGKKYGGPGTKLAVGDDAELADIVQELGCEIVETKNRQAVVDEENKIISTGAFANRTANFTDVHKGIGEAVKLLSNIGSGVKEVAIDWDFHDFYITKARGYTDEEWGIIKTDLQAMVERQQKKKTSEE